MGVRSLWETVLAVRERRQCCFGVVASLLHAIERDEPRLRCWATIDAEGALAAATALDVSLHAEDVGLGPLVGVAIGVKDVVDVAGLPTGCGSPRREGHRAERDAPVAAALKTSGAILLGKTVTTQFACFDPAETVNPWDAARTPGGSSSGSAAAVAAGMCPAAVGTQTGGSISRPAAYCGVVGWKPAHGAVSAEGVFPVSRRLDHVGCFTRSVVDVLPIREVLLTAGRDGAPTFCEVVARIAAVLEHAERPPELVVPRNFFVSRCDAEAARGFEEACDSLAAAGAELHSVGLPEALEEVATHHSRLMAADAYDVHRVDFEARPEDFAPRLRGMLERGRSIEQDALADADAFQEAFRQSLAGAVGERIVLTPAATCAAPADRSTTGDPALNAPWSLAGWPTIVVPCGLSEAGAPLAVQLAAPPRREEEMLAAAVWAEGVFRFADSCRPPWRRAGSV